MIGMRGVRVTLERARAVLPLANRAVGELCGIPAPPTAAATAVALFMLTPSEDPPECYICTDTSPTPRKSACLCTDRYVHDACFLKLLASQSRLAATKCSVCGADHGNLQVVEQRVVKACSLCGLLALSVCGILTLATILTSTAYAVSPATQNASLAFVVVSYVIMGIAILALVAVIATLLVNYGPRAIAESCLAKKIFVRLVFAPTVESVELPKRESSGAENA